MVARRVRLPDDRHKFISSLRADLPTLLKPEAAPLFDRGYPDSISVLSPTTPSLMALAELPVNADTPFHSIIGDRGLGGGEKSTDGVVRYASSHLPGASSEVFVPASHRTYENPEAIAEVKRILKLHVAEIERSGAARRSMANVHLCKGLESVLTIVDGKVVYGAQEFQNLGPAPLPVLPEWSPVKVYGGYGAPLDLREAARAGVPMPQVHKHDVSCHHHGCEHAAHQLLAGIEAARTRYSEFFGLGCDCFAF